MYVTSSFKKKKKNSLSLPESYYYYYFVNKKKCVCLTNKLIFTEKYTFHNYLKPLPSTMVICGFYLFMMTNTFYNLGS